MVCLVGHVRLIAQEIGEREREGRKDFEGERGSEMSFGLVRLAATLSSPICIYQSITYRTRVRARFSANLHDISPESPPLEIETKDEKRNEPLLQIQLRNERRRRRRRATHAQNANGGLTATERRTDGRGSLGNDRRNTKSRKGRQVSIDSDKFNLKFPVWWISENSPAQSVYS